MTSSRARVAATLFPLLLVGACSSGGSGSDTQGASSTSSVGASTQTSTAAAGDSTSSAPNTSTGAGTGSGAGASATGGAGSNRCHTSELSGQIVPADSGAGQRYATLVLRNRGGRTCTIHGYGGLGLVDGSGRALPTKQVREASPAPGTVTLTPGAKASSDLHWGAVPGPGDNQTGDCQPNPAALHVIPPDETTALSVPWDLGPVCQGGTIDQRAYVG